MHGAPAVGEREGAWPAGAAGEGLVRLVVGERSPLGGPEGPTFSERLVPRQSQLVSGEDEPSVRLHSSLHFSGSKSLEGEQPLRDTPAAALVWGRNGGGVGGWHSAGSGGPLGRSEAARLSAAV